jgi:hypothetical protein
LRANTLSPNRLITSISPGRLTEVYGLVLQPDPEARPAASVREIDVAHPSKRKGSGFELEVVKVLQAMSPAKPATQSRQRDFHRLDGVARRGADKARYFD